MIGTIWPMASQPELVRLPGPSLLEIDLPDGLDLSQQVFAKLPGPCGHSAATPVSEVQRLQSREMILATIRCGVGAGLHSSVQALAARQLLHDKIATNVVSIVVDCQPITQPVSESIRNQPD